MRQCAPLAEGSLLESAKTWKRDTACNTKNTSLKQTKGRMEVGEQLEHHIQSQSYSVCTAVYVLNKETLGWGSSNILW